ncbi:EamA family transporter RarD [Galactobacter valiniphilus]|uniref:EamA family transporter RarD n=1 Tax=Galactobacter valiniphilus TaxID=2676122 RepID=UPI003735B1E1
MTPVLPAPSSRRIGMLYGVAAYVMWGFLPLYFLTIATSSPVEIVAARVVFSLVLCALLLTVTRTWPSFIKVFTTPRLTFTLGLASALIAVNWLTYTFAVLGGNTAEGSLGYFINPLVSTALGVLVLKERLSRLQWAAMGIALLAVVVLAVGYGQIPWISLLLAFSFGFYGLVKNRVGKEVGAVEGLTAETAWLTPVALVVLAVMGFQGTLTIFSQGAGHFWLLAASGIATAVPLLAFAAAASRLPLTTVAMLQYIAPTMLFFMAVFVFHEPMPPERLAGFCLVWVAVVLLIIDALRQAKRAPHPAV